MLDDELVSILIFLSRVTLVAKVFLYLFELLFEKIILKKYSIDII